MEEVPEQLGAEEKGAEVPPMRLLVHEQGLRECQQQSRRMVVRRR